VVPDGPAAVAVVSVDDPAAVDPAAVAVVSVAAPAAVDRPVVAPRVVVVVCPVAARRSVGRVVGAAISKSSSRPS
jgi:hypothetical protein